jgi:hypothetical protein
VVLETVGHVPWTLVRPGLWCVSAPRPTGGRAAGRFLRQSVLSRESSVRRQGRGGVISDHVATLHGDQA